MFSFPDFSTLCITYQFFVFLFTMVAGLFDFCFHMYTIQNRRRNSFKKLFDSPTACLIEGERLNVKT